MTKLEAVRTEMERHDLAGLRLRGADWFAWVTGGANPVVLTINECGVAEALVTASEAVVLTSVIEAKRLRDEELTKTWEIAATPWQTPEARDTVVRAKARGRIASDRPAGDEVALPIEMLRLKRRLMLYEIERYRELGRDAEEAMHATLGLARPEWTERDLAGFGAAMLWKRGVQPLLTLAGGESRAAIYRHPVPTAAPLGRRALLVFSGRRYGLCVALSRWVYFDEPTEDERRRQLATHAVEAEAWRLSRPGAELSDVYRGMVDAYAQHGFAGEENAHHQGGSTGYLPRETIAGPTTDWTIESQTALAWNPSVPGAKAEDTVIVVENGVEILTRSDKFGSGGDFTIKGSTSG